AVSDVPLARRVGRDAHEPRLLGGVRRALDGRGGPRRSRAGVHERTGDGGLRGRCAGARAARGRADARRHHRRHARVLALARLRRPAALARAGEGRDAPRRGGGRERRLGSPGEEGRSAALATPRAPAARGARRGDRLPLHRGRPVAGGGARPAACSARREGRAGATHRLRGVSGVHDVGRLARLRRREGGRTRAAGARGRVPPDQDEGRRRPPLGRAARGADPRSARHGGRPDDGREPGLGRRRGDRVDARPWRVRSLVDRGADEPGRRARARADPERRRADPGRDGRARPEPRDLQAAVPGRSDRRLPDRRLPGRRRERGARDHPDGREVRDPGLPARRRRRALRVRAAPRGLRLRQRQPLARGPRRGVGRPSARALPRSRRRRARPLPRAERARLQHRDASLVARGVRLPRRAGLVGAGGARRLGMADLASPVEHGESRGSSPAADPRYRLLQAALFGLRAGPALILFVLVVVVSLTTPVFFTSRNIGNVLSQTAVISVLALGQLLVIVSRGIDLSVGSTVALSGVVGAIVFVHVHSTVVVVLAILGVGLAVGLANGIVFVVGRIPHPFIVTLASLSIVRGLALWAANGTLIAGMPHGVDTLGGGSIDWLPYSFFVVASLAVLAVIGTTYLVWGRWLYAVGGNPDAARRAGIPVGRVLVAVYVLSGLAA